MAGLCGVLPNSPIPKGQLISKWSFEAVPKKRTKTIRILVKTNGFVRFLEEIDDLINHFEINLPLHTRKLVKYISIYLEVFRECHQNFKESSSQF